MKEIFMYFFEFKRHRVLFEYERKSNVLILSVEEGFEPLLSGECSLIPALLVLSTSAVCAIIIHNTP